MIPRQSIGLVFPSLAATGRRSRSGPGLRPTAAVGTGYPCLRWTWRSAPNPSTVVEVLRRSKKPVLLVANKVDDANTERYSRLVSRMAKETQFLFISHNKIAMEMAEQLIGVTMQEQGVSRIVAVDMESAVSMAETV